MEQLPGRQPSVPQAQVEVQAEPDLPCRRHDPPACHGPQGKPGMGQHAYCLFNPLLVWQKLPFMPTDDAAAALEMSLQHVHSTAVLW